MLLDHSWADFEANKEEMCWGSSFAGSPVADEDWKEARPLVLGSEVNMGEWMGVG